MTMPAGRVPPPGGPQMSAGVSPMRGGAAR